MDREKAILIFHKNNYFNGLFHSMIVVGSTKQLDISFCYTNNLRNIEMINFLITPSPFKHEITIQSFDSVKKRGVIRPNIWEYFFIRINKSYFKVKGQKKKTMDCKEKNVYFIDLDKEMPQELKKRFNVLEIFYIPKHQSEIMEILKNFF